MPNNKQKQMISTHKPKNYLSRLFICAKIVGKSLIKQVISGLEKDNSSDIFNIEYILVQNYEKKVLNQ